MTAATDKTHVLAVRRAGSPDVLHFVKSLQRDGGWTACQDVDDARRFPEAVARETAASLTRGTDGKLVIQARRLEATATEAQP